MSAKKVMLNDEHLEQVSGGTVLPYIVQAGDSVRSIAEKYHVSPELLAKWNNIPNSDVIQVGQLLKIKY